MLHDRGEKADRPSDPQSVADQDLEAAKRGKPEIISILGPLPRVHGTARATGLCIRPPTRHRRHHRGRRFGGGVSQRPQAGGAGSTPPGWTSYPRERIPRSIPAPAKPPGRKTAGPSS